jgi:alpha/beta superfamily hydrolase
MKTAVIRTAVVTGKSWDRWANDDALGSPESFSRRGCVIICHPKPAFVAFQRPA